MSSSTSASERDLLLSFGQGVRTWLEQQHTPAKIFAQYSRIGRWTAGDDCENLLEYVYDDSYSTCDVAVIFGSWKPRDKGTHVTRTSVAHNAKRFVVIETPLINRKTSAANDHWRIGVNGFLNASASWPTLTAAVADRRLYDWSIKWTGWQSDPNGHIVVALQLPGDASLRGADINEWAYDVVVKLREQTDKHIVIRNHPLCSQRAFADHLDLAARLAMAGVDNLKFSDGYLVPWSEDLKNAYCTVTYTSGLAIDSVLNGVPTIACDPGNFAWGISSNFAEQVNDLHMSGQTTMKNWLRQLAGCQWSVKEMRDGTAWQAILPVLKSISC